MEDRGGPRGDCCGADTPCQRRATEGGTRRKTRPGNEASEIAISFRGKAMWESDNGNGAKSKMSGDGVDQDIAAVMGFSGFGEDSTGRAGLAYE